MTFKNKPSFSSVSSKFHLEKQIKQKQSWIPSIETDSTLWQWDKPALHCMYFTIQCYSLSLIQMIEKLKNLPFSKIFHINIPIYLNPSQYLGTISTKWIKI